MRSLLALLIFGMFSPSIAADSSPWRWKLEPGKSYAYTYRSTTDLRVELSIGMTGAMTDRIGVDTDFAIQVDRVLPDGRYDVRIPVSKLVIVSASGQKTTLDQLPAEVRTLRAWMSPRGQFEFYERVVVEVVDGSVQAIARVTPTAGGGATSEVGASAGGVTVAARATVDPRTGRVAVQGGVREQAPPTRQVEQDKPVQHVDVLPVDILALLELPEGVVTPGQELRVDAPVGAIRVIAGDPQPCGAARCGHLRMVVSADSAPVTRAATGPATGPAPAGDDDFSSMFAEMDAEMATLNADLGQAPLGLAGGAGGAGGFGAHGASPSAAAMPTMQVDADVTALFDAAAGRTHTVEGRGGSSTRSMGMTMSESTTFTLSFVGVR